MPRIVEEDIAAVEVDLEVGPIDYVYVDLRRLIGSGIVVSVFRRPEGAKSMAVSMSSAWVMFPFRSIWS